MISVIISSYKANHFDQFKLNVANTIGVDYEIVKIDNPGLMSICEAYNRGAKKAKYDILCFCHDDIHLMTAGWGRKVIDLFTDENVGLIGVAGTKYKTYMPSGWSYPFAEDKLYACINIIQGYKHTSLEAQHIYNNPDKQSTSQVVALDGVWFCTRQKVLNEFSFDSTLFTSFHCYDIDFSLQVNQKYNVMVTYDILLEHLSEGNFDKSWIEETIKLHKKWKGKLPANYVPTGHKMQATKDYEYKALYQFVKKLYLFKLPFAIVFSYLWSDSLKAISILGLKSFAKIQIKHLLGYKG